MQDAENKPCNIGEKKVVSRQIYVKEYGLLWPIVHKLESAQGKP